MWLTFLLACGAPSPVADPNLFVLPDAGARSWSATLASLDAVIAATEERAAASPNSWMVRGELASAWLQRARLSGDLADYEAAEAALGEAFAIAPAGSGPLLTRAALNSSLHRFDRIEADLQAASEAVLVDDPTWAAILRIDADLAWNVGEYDDAEVLLDESLALDETISGRSDLAMRAWRQLDFTEAEAQLAVAEDAYHGLSPEPLAWFDLQRGLMDLERGRYDEALVHYQDADADLPGYWLVREHIAEILVLQGHIAHADAIYRQCIDQTGSPELMDALSGIVEGPEAEVWRQQADAGWQDALARYPESAWGHALGFYIDTPEGLEMALANVALRPGAESWMWLAQAQLAAGEDAVDAVETALQSPWRTAELHVTASQAYEAAGETALAAEHRALALAIHPGAFDE